MRWRDLSKNRRGLQYICKQLPSTCDLIWIRPQYIVMSWFCSYRIQMISHHDSRKPHSIPNSIPSFPTCPPLAGIGTTFHRVPLPLRPSDSAEFHPDPTGEVDLHIIGRQQGSIPNTFPGTSRILGTRNQHPGNSERYPGPCLQYDKNPEALGSEFGVRWENPGYPKGIILDVQLLCLSLSLSLSLI